MELKNIKRINNTINNTLPKFDDGNDYWSSMGNPNNALGWNKWSLPDYVTNPQYLKGLGSDAYDASNPMSIIMPRINNIYDPQSDAALKSISSIKVNSTKPNNSAAGLKAAAVIGGAANLAGGFINQMGAVKSSDELLANAGQSQGNVMGISYQRLNGIDADSEMSAVTKAGISNTISSVATGASAGAAFGPIGAAVGGVVGGITGLIGLGTSKAKLRKRIENARVVALRRNTYNMSTAMSTGLQQDYYSNNASGGLLYANDGKDLKQPIYE